MELDRTNEPEVPVGRLLKSPEAFTSNSDFKFLGKEPLAPGAEVEFFRHWMDCWVEVRDLHKIKDFYESQIDLLVAYLFERDLDLDLAQTASRHGQLSRAATRESVKCKCSGSITKRNSSVCLQHSEGWSPAGVQTVEADVLWAQARPRVRETAPAHR